MKESRIELPWATPKKPGFAGKAPGLFFWYHATRKQAEKMNAYLKKTGKYVGPVEYRPGECYELGVVI